MKRYILVLVVVFCLMFSVSVFAEDQTMELTTYYPAPYGDYDSLKTDSMAVGSGYAVPASDGDLVIEGNVGIGTETPAHKLDVNGRIRASESNHQFRLNDAETGADEWTITTQSDQNLAFFENGTISRLMLEAGGNVGIGTTNPNARLEVAGDLRVGNYTLPSTDGTNGQVLQTNGNGVLSWVAPSGGLVRSSFAQKVMRKSANFLYNGEERLWAALRALRP